ncbi:MAG: hypothetical protein Q7R33_04110 [Nitrosarchaeum sp.]|nr:hypothetical protein [Nitrosarchaeum sp.]
MSDNNIKKKKAAKNATTQFVDISDIRGPLVILNDGSLRAIILCTSINFELKSSDEKDALRAAFQNYVNLIDFPMQIVINSQKLDITQYLEYLDENIHKETNSLLRMQATEYKKFIKGLTELNEIVSKNFYVVVPYYKTEMSVVKTGFKERLNNLFRSTKKDNTLSDEDLEKYVEQLDQRVAVTRNGLEQMGVSTNILMEDELKRMYISYYNPTI